MRRPDVIAIALAALTGTARAEVRRVALIEMPSNVGQAVSSTLEPWSIEVVEVEGPGRPGAAMPRNAEEARALGREHGAEAVVWIAGDAGSQSRGASLWVYDADSDRVVARELPSGPPYDEPTAAGVALSVKTLLRHSEVAPEQERFGAREPLERPRGSSFAVESLGGVRVRPSEAGDLEPRLGVGIAWAPRSPGPPLALALLVRTGPGVGIEDPEFVGHLSDLSVTAAGRIATGLDERIRVAGWIGPTLHVVRLEGAVLPEDRSSEVSRLNPSLDAGGLFELRLGGDLFLQLRAEGGLAVRRQRFLVRGAPVLALPGAELELGLGLAMAVL